MSDEIVSNVRERYGRLASTGSSCCGESSVRIGYDEQELRSIPEEADLGLGCGAPVDRLELAPGEVVLDLGSGGGIDAFLAARQVGPEGKVYGVDMTPEMLARARGVAEKRGYDNVEFREGRLEALPIDDASVDAVTSNCVINLVPDKAVVFREIARVLRPGGRLVISDIVLDGPLPEVVEQSVLAWVGCVSGALARDRYFDLVERSGLTELAVLSDVDFLGALGGLPEDVSALLREAGVEAADLAGKVRSITFRAVKPSAAG